MSLTPMHYISDGLAFPRVWRQLLRLCSLSVLSIRDCKIFFESRFPDEDTQSIEVVLFALRHVESLLVASFGYRILR